MEQLIGIMMQLLRQEICDGQIDGSASLSFSDEALKQLYILSKSHDLAHLVGSALDKIGALSNGEIAEKFRKQTFMAVYRHERTRYELEQISAVLEAAQIPFMPLKGSLIRRYYPEPWMRTSCDIDVLVHEEDLDRAVNALVEQLHFRAEDERNYHDISLHSESGIHLELHFNIKECMDHIDRLLTRVWDYSAKVEGKAFEYEQSKEYLIFHMLAHMSYHFVVGGCGIRPFMDFYLLKTKMGYDDDMVRMFCRECEIETFYDRVLDLTNAWFGDGLHTPTTKSMEAYLLSGGVYGTQTNKIAVAQEKKGGKIKYLLQRIFMPYHHLKTKYPILEKYRVLTPVYQVRRWLSLIFKGRWKNSVRELKTTKSISKDHAQQIACLMEELGL